MSTGNNSTPLYSPRLRAIVLVAALALGSTAPPLLAIRAADEERLANQPRSEYRARRQRLMERIKDGVIVLMGAREDDFGEVDRFRQKNNFIYLTGVSSPGAFMMLIPAGLTANNGAREILFIPPRNPSQEQWTGVRIGPGAEAEARFGAEEVASSEKFYDRLRDVLSAPPFKAEAGGRPAPVKVYTVVPTGPGASLTRESQFIDAIRRAVPSAQVNDLSPHLAEMRKVKSPAEIALLQKAIDITLEAHASAARAIKPGAFEYEVQAALEYTFGRNGAERPGFPSIVGSGINSTILHHMENRKRIEAGDLVVVDIGAEYSYYTADVTRTYPAGGKFTARQREIYQLVLEAQRAAERAFKPGQTTVSQLHNVAYEVMRSSPLRDKHGGTLEKYFIHGLSHWLGMEAHDVGDYFRPIPAGAVFTIEPGIYIPDEKLGVRVEDDYLATATGLVKMSGKLPSDPDEIERMMSRGEQ